MDLAQINYVAVIVSALLSFVIGWIWYSPIMFGKTWMKENGFKEEDLKKVNMVKIYSTSFVLALVIAFNLAAFIGSNADLLFGLSAGAAVGIGWVAASFGITYLFEQKSIQLFLINAGYQAVTYIVMGGLLAVWK